MAKKYLRQFPEKTSVVANDVFHINDSVSNQDRKLKFATLIAEILTQYYDGNFSEVDISTYLTAAAVDTPLAGITQLITSTINEGATSPIVIASARIGILHGINARSSDSCITAKTYSSGSTTGANVYNALILALPTGSIGKTILINGRLNGTGPGDLEVYYATRTNTTTITLYGWSTTLGAISSYAITSSTGGPLSAILAF